MPTYQYQCKKCGHTLEELQSMSEPPLVHCPHCNTDSLVRVLGGGTGLIFKGSGFYLTDYKNTGSRKSSGEKKDSKGDGGKSSGKPPAAKS
ncbi:MAG: zinc ribbon domain-containing protein [Bacteroidota bacterium]